MNMIGVVAARPGCSTILMTQVSRSHLISMDCDRNGGECEVYLKINQSSSRFIDCRGYANTILVLIPDSSLRDFFLMSLRDIFKSS